LFKQKLRGNDKLREISPFGLNDKLCKKLNLVFAELAELLVVSLDYRFRGNDKLREFWDDA